MLTTAVDGGLKAFDALLSFFVGGFTGEWDNERKTYERILKTSFRPI